MGDLAEGEELGSNPFHVAIVTESNAAYNAGNPTPRGSARWQPKAHDEGLPADHDRERGDKLLEPVWG